MLGAGLALQTIGLYIRGSLVGGCPIGNVFELVQFVCWSVVVLCFLVGSVFRLSLLGLFIAGLAFLLGGGSLLVPGWDAPYEVSILGGHPMIELHASLALFSYGVLGMLSLTAAMFLCQDQGLRIKSGWNFFVSLPSLVELDQINRRLLSIALVGLGVALMLGWVVWFYGISQKVADGKLWVTEGLWVSYALVGWLRRSGRIRSKTMAWLLLFLFVIALISLWPVEAARGSHTQASSGWSGPALHG